VIDLPRAARVRSDTVRIARADAGDRRTRRGCEAVRLTAEQARLLLANDNEVDAPQTR
jgi:hypothetical protein